MEMNEMVMCFGFVLLTLTSAISVPFVASYVLTLISRPHYRKCCRCEKLKPLELTHMLCEDCIDELVNTEEQ